MFINVLNGKKESRQNSCVLDQNTLQKNITTFERPNSWKDLEKRDWAKLVKDGEWSPSNCISEQRIAIIVPYRDRQQHLYIFINHIHQFLQKQLVSYGIFVIEQAPERKFNRGTLLNIGFKEALKQNFTCFIFHDVDMLPIDERNIYRCRHAPFHLTAAVDKFQFRLPYSHYTGGAMAMTTEQFERVNGYSNIYFGWGAEDDDISSRIDAVGYKIDRNPYSIARYIMISHSRDKGNPINTFRDELLRASRTRFREDGINSLSYVPISGISETSLFRKNTVQVGIILEKWKKLYKLSDE